MKKSIVARGIRVHNLKNITVEIPHKKFVVITGVSGSGKSSLAFDTLFAEGQRRYIESFSAYARQFLDKMDKPDVDHIEGIPPAIAIQQKNPVKNRRSTVGTATEINDYLRLLFARIGKTCCSNCKRHVQIDTVPFIVETILSLPEGTRFLVTFPLTISQNVPCQTQVNLLKERGLIRLLVDNTIIDITAETRDYDIRSAKMVYGIIDRLVVRDVIKERLVDAIETAYRMGAGHLSIIYNIPTASAPCRLQGSSIEIQGSKWIELKYSKQFFCSYCNIEYPEPVPALFSFNNPVGACPVCQGFGNTIAINLDTVIPDKEKTLNQGAIAPWNTPAYSIMFESMKKAASAYNIPLNLPFQKLSNEQVKLILEGTKDFCGIYEFFRKLEQQKYKMHIRVFLSKYRGYTLCQHCKGTRLKKQALNVLIKNKNIQDICTMTVDKAHQFFGELQLTDYESGVAHLLLQEIKKRLAYMIKVGLEYLTLDRMTRTLSGGEAQRVNLTASLGSSLVNTLYILDEPSVGLHPKDTDRLIHILKQLQNIGNTIVVVEHEKEVIRKADKIIDIGPGAGENGGTIVYQGSFDKLPANNSSLTGQYLKGNKDIKIPKIRRKFSKRAAIVLRGASQNNLKGIDVVFPLHMLVCITGVSGSGKSTLVQDTLYGAIKKKKMQRCTGFDGKYESIEGTQLISDVILVDQTPIGRTPRSNPVTYLKIFDEIRKLFASTRDARLRKLDIGSFSFNVAGGRCEHCEGAGYITVDMQFLADIDITCDKCGGKRFSKRVLDVKYKNKNIHEVLEMTVDEAIIFFYDSPRITKGLRFLEDTGLSYLKLGQPATTLSGGEAQRLKISAHMAQEEADSMLFIFDEPTTGLHMDDIQKLLASFQKLIGAGHSLIVVEHNLDIIKSADYIIDMGPEGGNAGGYIVACGTPEQIAQAETSYTGNYLKPYFP
ncbi:MAG: excinuclease ABC subunit UvrA [Candidatus Loosdrechtia sp.]|uniref:excinuclease ABC subunit UvrA n=1 Tax=Candidatus Loosdrechtia sp. TaxID=3101272 RepID=UPI003A74D1C1|nr:MAG: excinuclease ABC subunit UvrA [Candidatus Jettenia sp. AMX2]